MPSAGTARRAIFIPSNNLGNATSETQFSNGRGSLLILPLDSNGKLSNTSFRVRCSGRVATITNTTFTLNIYFGISATIGSNTQLFTSGAVTVNNTTSSFEIWMDCFWSADANQITGRVTGQMNNSILGPSTLLNTPVSANPSRDSSTTLATGTAYGFTVTGLFGGSSTGNSAIIDDFSMDSV